jgi:hypothetical protein
MKIFNKKAASMQPKKQFALLGSPSLKSLTGWRSSYMTRSDKNISELKHYSYNPLPEAFAVDAQRIHG